MNKALKREDIHIGGIYRVYTDTFMYTHPTSTQGRLFESGDLLVYFGTYTNGPYIPYNVTHHLKTISGESVYLDHQLINLEAVE